MQALKYLDSFMVVTLISIKKIIFCLKHFVIQLKMACLSFLHISEIENNFYTYKEKYSQCHFQYALITAHF